MKKLQMHPAGKLFSVLIGLAMTTAVVNAAEGDLSTRFPDQADFPVIVLQPVDQLAALGGTATFEVVASNGPLTYQWLRKGVAIPGATNSTFTLSQVSLDDVGTYSCNVSKGAEVAPTRGAQLNAFTSSKSAGVAALTSSDVIVYAAAVTSSGSNGICPGSYIGYVNYTKTTAQGWGWAPTSGSTNHTATDATRTNTKVEYRGKLADTGCNQTTVTVPHPTVSTKYRFTIYFTNNVPTNSYPITLSGFDP